MTDGIGRILGGNSYGVGYVPHRKEQEVKEDVQPATTQQSYKEVNPDDVLAFLAGGTSYVNQKGATKEVQPEVANRVQDSIAKFETIAKVVEEEFGSDAVPIVMELMMEKEFSFS